MGFLDRLRNAFTGTKQPPLESKSEGPAAGSRPSAPETRAEPAPAPEPQRPAAPEPADEAASDRGKTYTVQPGDTLWKIAETHYGSGAKYTEIFDANRDLLDDPNKIYPGQELKIP